MTIKEKDRLMGMVSEIYFSNLEEGNEISIEEITNQLAKRDELNKDQLEYLKDLTELDIMDDVSDIFKDDNY